MFPTFWDLSPTLFWDKILQEYLQKNQSLLWETIKTEMVQNGSYQTTVPLEFVTFDKLLIPVYCSISRLWQRQI